ncbi:hypothetical protein [Candidatus Burkholderia verschuerenii]|uniref:hypothetical protein n=1 Tax=Candidatus Burkholderia verschuerenii TaxID=242163 RepID=UPI0018DB7966|nr:hypothetical protein [Candidatus Burkholderia verschuerenii]
MLEARTLAKEAGLGNRIDASRTGRKPLPDKRFSGSKGCAAQQNVFDTCRLAVVSNVVLTGSHQYAADSSPEDSR